MSPRIQPPQPPEPDNKPLSLSILVPIAATVAAVVAAVSPLVNYLSNQAGQLARIETSQESLSEKIKDIDQQLKDLEGFIRNKSVNQ